MRDESTPVVSTKTFSTAVGTSRKGARAELLVGGGRGAAIGAVSAVGVGVVHTLSRGKSVTVPAEAVLTVRLERPLAFLSSRVSANYRTSGRQVHPDCGDRAAGYLVVYSKSY